MYDKDLNEKRRVDMIMAEAHQASADSPQGQKFVQDWIGPAGEVERLIERLDEIANEYAAQGVWIDGTWTVGDGAHPDYTEPALSWCTRCAQEMCTRICASHGESPGLNTLDPDPGDGPKLCEGCTKVIEYTLNETGHGQELMHFRCNPPDSGIGPDDAYALARILEAGPAPEGLKERIRHAAAPPEIGDGPRIVIVTPVDIRDSIEGINPIGIALARARREGDARGSESTFDYSVVDGVRCYHDETIVEWIEDWWHAMQEEEELDESHRVLVADLVHGALRTGTEAR